MEILIGILIALTAIYLLMILLFFYGLRIRHLGTVDHQPPVTVIIAARNEEANIGVILSNLAEQSYPADRFEVIVVNDQSTDRTEDIIKSFSEKYDNFHLLTVTDLPPGFSPKKYAIQQAVQRATGEIICATDADCRVGPNWIARMVRYFSDDVGFVIGFSQFGAPGEDRNLIEKLQAFDFVELMSVAVATTNLGFPLAASGQNLAYRKAAFQQVGGYSRVSHRVSGDDVLLLQLVRKYTDYHIIFAAHPESFAVSEPQPTLRDFINQRKRWASNGSIQLKLNFGFFTYLMLVFLFNAFLTAVLVGALFTGQGWAAFWGCFGARAFFEFILGIAATRYFRRPDVLRYFGLWFIGQIPYILWTATLGTLGRFNWKERVHSAQI